MRRGRVAHVLVLLVLASGAVTATTGVVDGPAARAAGSPDDFRDATTIDLLSRGAQPRDRLRLASAAGSTSEGTVREDLVTKQTVSGIEQPATQVTVTADLRTTVTSVDEDGVRTISFVYDNSNLPELNGAGGSYVVTDRGFTSDGTFTYPPGTDAATQDALGQLQSDVASLSTPFPFEAVGVGARWRVTEHPTANGVTSTQVVVFTLVARDDNRIVLRTKIRRSAPTQPIETTDLPTNATATLVGTRGNGAGDVTVDLNQVLPNASTVLQRDEQAILVEQGTQRAQITQTVTRNLAITTMGSAA
jgi:hypothetical protein